MCNILNGENCKSVCPAVISMTQLRKQCAYWQRALRLQDWEVKLTVSRRSQFTMPRCQGVIDWVLPTRQAYITLLDPRDFPGTPFMHDIEVTLVHELLHLYVAPFHADEDTLADHAQEQMIDALAQALVRLRKQADGKRASQ